MKSTGPSVAWRCIWYPGSPRAPEQFAIRHGRVDRAEDEPRSPMVDYFRLVEATKSGGQGIRFVSPNSQVA